MEQTELLTSRIEREIYSVLCLSSSIKDGVKGSKVWGCGASTGVRWEKKILALPTKSCATGVLQCRDLWVVAVVLWRMQQMARVSGLDISSSSSAQQ